MTQTLKQEVEALINAEGKMQKAAVYERFALVGKRFIDAALTELATERRIVVGSAEVAPLRAAAQVFDRPTPPEKHLSPRAGVAEERATVTQRVLALFAPGQVLQPIEIIERLPTVKPARIREALMRLKSDGKLENMPRAGYWLPQPEEEGAEA